MNFGMLVFMIITKLVRGPGGGKESIFGLDICDPISWVAYASLWAAALILTLLAAKIASADFKRKTENGYTFTKGD